MFKAFKVIKFKISNRRSKFSIKIVVFVSKNQTKIFFFFFDVFTFENIIYSFLFWTIKNRTLNWKLIQILKKHENIKTNVWTKFVDVMQKKTKIEWYERTTFELLKNNAKFKLYILNEKKRI